MKLTFINSAENMKKILFVLLLVVSTGVLFSQEMTEYTWSTYKTSFKIPTDFVVTENDSSKFIAGDTNNTINLSIYPQIDENLNFDQMSVNLENWALNNNVTELGPKTDFYTDDTYGYDGIYVKGTANGLPVILVLLMDPDYMDICFYIWINYTQDRETTANQILESFTPN